MKPLPGNPRGDRTAAQAKLVELMPGDHPVLPIGELRKRLITATARSCIYFVHEGAFAAHHPIVAAVERRVGRRA
jgi:hypothetical protein